MQTYSTFYSKIIDIHSIRYETDIISNGDFMV